MFNGIDTKLDGRQTNQNNIGMHFNDFIIYDNNDMILFVTNESTPLCYNM